METSNDFKIVVANSPKLYDGKIDLTSEWLSLQTSILYADKVQFFSLAYTVISFLLNSINEMNFEPFLSFTLSGERKITYALSSFYLSLRRRFNDKEWNTLTNKMGLSKSDEEFLLKNMNLNSKHLREELEQVAGNAFIQIEKALQLDFVTLQKFDFPLHNIGTWRNADNLEAAKVISQYLSTLLDITINNNIYPLFDSPTALSVSVSSDSSSFAWKSKGIRLLHDLLNRLPVFERATLTEILDIRKDLHKPLIRFRAAILEFADGIEKEVWDKDFPNEAEKLFRLKVERAVLDIEEEVKSIKPLRDLVLNAANVGVPSTIGAILGAAGAMPQVMLTALAIGAGGSALAGLQTLKKYQEKMQKVKGNQLYFYYKAGERLKGKK
jgi:hypothetical protein